MLVAKWPYLEARARRVDQLGQQRAIPARGAERRGGEGRDAAARRAGGRSGRSTGAREVEGRQWSCVARAPRRRPTRQREVAPTRIQEATTSGAAHASYGYSRTITREDARRHGDGDDGAWSVGRCSTYASSKRPRRSGSREKTRSHLRIGQRWHHASSSGKKISFEQLRGTAQLRRVNGSGVPHAEPDDHDPARQLA